jgi:hypothetical protein
MSRLIGATTMSDTKQVNWLPWIAVAALGYMLWTTDRAPIDPVVPVPVLASPSKTLDACYLADRSSKLEVLKSVAAMTGATDEQRLKQFNDLSSSNRVKDFQPYIDIVSVALVDDKLGELISKLQAKK